MVHRERASVRLLSFIATSLCVLGRRGVILAFKRRSFIQTFMDNRYQPSVRPPLDGKISIILRDE